MGKSSEVRSKLDDIRIFKSFLKKEIQRLEHKSIEINDQFQHRCLVLYGHKIELFYIEKENHVYTCDKCPKCRAPIITNNKVYDIEGTCAICLDKFIDLVMLHCGHCFCTEYLLTTTRWYFFMVSMTMRFVTTMRLTVFRHII